MADIPPFDPGHPAVGGTQAWLSTDVRDSPNGQVLILTIRVPNATTTVVLGKDDAEAWDRQIHAAVGGMSGLILAPPGATLAPFRPGGR
jgi:hypothetical protein